MLLVPFSVQILKNITIDTIRCNLHTTDRRAPPGLERLELGIATGRQNQRNEVNQADKSEISLSLQGRKHSMYV